MTLSPSKRCVACAQLFLEKSTIDGSPLWASQQLFAFLNESSKNKQIVCCSQGNNEALGIGVDSISAPLVPETYVRRITRYL